MARYKKFLNGSIYNNLSSFHVEFGGGSAGGSYIPLVRRRPSVLYNLPKIVVDESVTMLFGLDHFPQIRSSEFEEEEQFLQYVTRKSKLKRVMLEAAKIGSVGSVCVLVKILKGNFHFEVLGTRDVMPYFDRLEPERLVRLVQKRKIDGSSLRSQGYTIKNDEINRFFYLVRELNESEEIFYMPYLCDKDKEEGFVKKKDNEGTERHGFGFAPAVWIKNLPCTQAIDGECTFECILDILVEVEYQLSQEGRLLRYNSDPTLVIKNPVQLDGAQLIKGSGTISLDEKGEAYYAEITGKSTEAVNNYVDKLREFALEVCRGNRSTPEKLNTAQSGKALQMLNSALIGLVSEMQITYGDDGLLKIYEMISDIASNKKYKINYGGKEVPPNLIKAKDNLTLDWPEWYPKSAQEELQEAQTLTTYKDSGILSTETVLKVVAEEFHVVDIKKELNSIVSEKDIEYSREAKIDTARGARTKKLSGA